MDARLNQLAKVDDFERALILAQYAHEEGFRAGSALEFYQFVKSKLDLTGLSNTAGLPEEFPEPNTTLEATNAGEWTVLGPGLYSKIGAGTIELAEDEFAFAQFDGADFNRVLRVKVPQKEGTDILDPQGEGVPKEKAVAKYIHPIYNLLENTSNLSDNDFVIGGWLSGTGSAQTTANVKRLESILITNDLVGQHWINGRGLLAPDYSYIIVKPSGGGSPTPVIDIPGRGNEDLLEPLTFNITPEMIGMYLRLSPGQINYEPVQGYENSFTWNMGATPLESFTPYGKYIKGDNVKRKYTPKIYNNIAGESGGIGSGFYRYDTGAHVTSAGRKIITFTIEDDSLNYAISGHIPGSTLIADAMFYSENMEYLGYNERMLVPTNLDRKILKPLPEGTRYLISGNFNEDSDLILETFEAGEEIFEAPIFTGDLEIQNGEVKKILGYDIQSEEAFLQNKTITKLGDSIVRSPSGVVGFVEQIALKYSMNINDYSVGGATITYNANGTNDIVRQVEQAIVSNLSTDYIVFNGQTNDILASRDVSLGDISAGYNATLDRETFTGALEWICRSLKTNWPQAKIVYVRVHHMDTRPYDRQEIFGGRVLEVMKKWSIPVADIYNDGQINTFIPIHRQLFTNNEDGTHPNSLGYTKFYVPIVENKLRNI